MTKIKGATNLLWAYSPAKPDRFEYESYYPGDDVVQIIAFDHYLTASKAPDSIQDSSAWMEPFIQSCERIVGFARKHGKIAAVGETGVTKHVRARHVHVDAHGCCRVCRCTAIWSQGTTMVLDGTAPRDPEEYYMFKRDCIPAHLDQH